MTENILKDSNTDVHPPQKQMSQDVKNGKELEDVVSCSEKDHLLPTPTWTKQDILLLTQAALVEFGDGVEVFLPGTITQLVSCELNVSKVQEGLLGVILITALAFSLIAFSSVANRYVFIEYSDN